MVRNFRVGGADRRPSPVPNREISEMLARLALALLILAATGAGAEAHHVMGGTTPRTLAQGLAHPVIGLDHLAFTVAAGLLAARLAPPLAGAALMPLAFLAAGAVGASLHLAGVDL